MALEPTRRVGASSSMPLVRRRPSRSPRECVSAAVRALAGTAGLLCFFILFVDAPTAHAQIVEGVVLETPTGEPLAGTAITALRGDSAVAATLSGPEGRFRLTLPEGTFTVRAERIGYESDETTVTISGAARWSIVLELASAPVEMDTIQATVESRVYEPEGVMQRSGHIAAGERLARLEGAGASTRAAIGELPGVQTRELTRDERRALGLPVSVPCVQASRRVLSVGGDGGSGCAMVVFILNGGRAGPEVLLDPLSTFESIEFLPPADAGMRYGMEAGTRGALVFWIRGSGPRRSPERNPGTPE